MAIPKKYYTLDEAIAKLGATYKPRDLVYLGVHEDLPIYVLAADWDVGVCIQGGAEILTGDADESLRRLRPFSHSFTDSLNGLQRLHERTLSKFEADPDAEVPQFIVERQDREGNRVLYEYRLQGSAITAQSLIVMADDVAWLRKQSIAEADKPLGTKQQNTLLKLVVGMAVACYGFDQTQTKSDVASSIHKDLALKDIHVDEDTIRKWLKVGAELLPPKSQKG